MGLFVCVEGHDARSLDLDRDSVTLGRGPVNDIVLADKLAARRHVGIDRRGDDLFVRDLDSPAGVYVEGHRVGREAPLPQGARIRVGSTTVRAYLDRRSVAWPPGSTLGGRHRVRGEPDDEWPTLLEVDEGEHVRTALVEHARREAYESLRIPSNVCDHGFDASRACLWIVYDVAHAWRLSSRAAPCELASRILERTAKALADMHAEGFVHGDLRARNVLVSTSEQGPRVHLIDGGITVACQGAMQDAEGPEIDVGDGIAPEVAHRWTAALSPASDVWSLGILAFELVTGARFWRTPDDRGSVLRQILLEPIPAASLRARELGARAISGAFDAWFARCMARDPAHRFADAGAAWSALVHVE